MIYAEIEKYYTHIKTSQNKRDELNVHSPLGFKQFFFTHYNVSRKLDFVKQINTSIEM